MHLAKGDYGSVQELIEFQGNRSGKRAFQVLLLLLLVLLEHEKNLATASALHRRDGTVLATGSSGHIGYRIIGVQINRTQSALSDPDASAGEQ